MNAKQYDPAIFDKEELLNLMGDDEKLLSDVLDVFLGDVPGQIAAIKKAIDGRDSEKLSHQCHNLKGASLNVAAPQLASIALKIENAGKANDLKLASNLVSELEIAFVIFRKNIGQ